MRFFLSDEGQLSTITEMIIVTFFLLFGITLTPEPLQAQDNFLELSGYIGGEGNEKVNAAVIHNTGNWRYMYVVGQSSSKESWMPSGPRRGGLAPGCNPQRVAGNLTIQCGGIGTPQNGYIARYTIAGEPSGFAFFGSAGGASEVTDIAVNDQGHIFIVGWTSEELTYGRNLYNGGQRDAFVARLDTTKFDPKDTGPALEESNSPVRWAKHIGGDGRDQALAVDINQEGDPVVVGETTSEEFPTAGTESKTEKDDDSARFDNEVEKKKIEKKDKVKIKGEDKLLQQPNSNSYRGGSSDAFVTVLSKDGHTYRKSFFLGGDAEDIARDVAVDENQIYIAGSTKSSVVKSPWGTLTGGTANDNNDAFLFRQTTVPTRVDTGQLINNRSGNQVATGVDILKDNYNNKSIVLAGYVEQSHSSANDGFVALYENITQGDGEPITYNEIGGNGNDRINALQVVNQDYAPSSTINLVGTTGSGNFGSRGEIPDAVAEYKGGKDAFLMQMNNNAEDIEYMALLGGTGSDRGLGLAVTDEEIFNAFGSTNSSDFIFKRAPYSSLQGSSDGFISRLSPSDQRPTNISLRADVPQEFMMEDAPISYNLEIHNKENTDAKDVTLTGKIEGGSVSSVPDNCTTSGAEDVRCTYDEISGRRMKTLEIKVQPLNAPRMVDVTFEVSTASREYKIEDNKVGDSTEVISKIDLQVDFIEVTQGIQDRRHSIPLVKDKTTYARVYVTATRQTVDSGELLVNTGPFTAELTGRDKNGEIQGSPIKPVAKAPASIRPVDGMVRGTSVSTNLGDTLNGHQVIGGVAGGNDAYRYTGSTPSFSLDNTSGADVKTYNENRIVITGEGKTGNTNYTIVVDSVLSQPNRTLIGHTVSTETEDKLNSERKKVTGKLGEDPDGITYRGELKRIELGNPSAADVLVEKGGVIVIESKGGGTEFTIDDTTKLDANTFDRNAKQAFDFRLPSEWVDGEHIELEATVNPNNSIDEARGGLGNSEETDSYKLWRLSPICIRTQPVRTNSSLPDGNLKDNEQGPDILRLAEAQMPTPRIRIFPNSNAVTPGWVEPGDTFELDKGNENDDGSRIITLLGYRALTGTSPSWCDERGARTHWAGLVNPSDADYGGRGRIGGKLFWIELARANNDWEQINSPYGGTSLAHELGHNYSFNHVNCPPGGPDGPYENYPFNNCLLGPDKKDAFFGYDTRDSEASDTPKFAGQRGIHPNLTAITPKMSRKDNKMSDVMSYADHSWSSSYYWMKLFLKFNRGLVEPSGSKINPAFGKQNNLEAMLLKEDAGHWNRGDQKGGPLVPTIGLDYSALGIGNKSLERRTQIRSEKSIEKEESYTSAENTSFQDKLVLVKGLINVNNQTSTRIEAIELERSILNSDKAKQLLKANKSNPDYPVRVELKDANGKIIADKAVGVSRITHSGIPGQRMFTTALPWSPEIDEVEVTMWDETLGRVSIAETAPDVEISVPDKEEVEKGELFSAQWSVSGVPNTDEVRYMVHYSSDNGNSWQPVSMNHKSQEIKLDPANLAGSTDSARLRVIAIWQGRSSSAVSESFRVAGHKPEPQIQSPKEDHTYKAGGQAYLEGSAYDMDDGYLTGDALQWQLIGPDGKKREVGNGEELTVFNLSPGTYEVSLTVTDSDGMTSYAQTHFVVQAPGGSYQDTSGLMRPGMKDQEKKEDSDKGKDQIDKSDKKVDRSDTGSTFTLKPKGGFSLPGVSSFGDITGLAGSNLQEQTSVFTWGASLTLGSRDGFANLRLSGLHRSASTVTTLQNDQIITTEVDMSFSALSAELVVNPLPRIIVQPYAMAGYGARKLSFDGNTGDNIDENWKQTVPVGAGADLPLGSSGVVLGVEVVDYISNFSGEGNMRHDAFLLGYIGIPL